MVAENQMVSKGQSLRWRR